MSEQQAQRRLAAIVSTDVVGYSRLIGVDEAGTLARMKLHRHELCDPEIERHKGRIVGTAGDSLLVEFISAVSAVNCALAIQRGMAEREADLPKRDRMLLRIGVNIGEVVVDDDDIFGDGVNVAARLQAIAPAGGICLSETAARQVQGKVSASVLAGGRRNLKNIKGRQSVFVIAPPDVHTLWRFGYRSTARVAGSLLVFVVLAFAVWWGAQRMRSAFEAPLVAEPSVPVVMVLPFANQTGDASQDYVADGLTDELIGSIGRFHTLRVIGRNAGAAFRHRSDPHNEILAKLGARYVVEGGVRRDGKRVRVSVRMTDAASGTVLWSEAYDGDLVDLIDFQEAIGRQIAGRLAANIGDIEVEQHNSPPKPDADAYDLVLHARSLGLYTSRQANRGARQLLREAIDKDPDYASAYALLSEAVLARVILGWTEFLEQELSEGERLARHAIAISPGEPDGYRVLGQYLSLRGDFDRAAVKLRRAIEINPSDATAIAALGTGLTTAGQLEAGIEMLERASRYDPEMDPARYFDLAVGYYLAHRFDDALRIVAQETARSPQFAFFDVIGAAAAARLGRNAEAEQYAHGIRKRLPNFNVRELGSRYRNPTHGDDLREGLRMAGFGSE